MSEELIKCPKCGSTQLTTTKKGFSGKQAVAGAVLTGGIGLLAGTIGSNKIKITCLACGKEFKPGEDLEAKRKKEEELKKFNESPAGKGCTYALIIGFLIFMIFLVVSC